MAHDMAGKPLATKDLAWVSNGRKSKHHKRRRPTIRERRTSFEQELNSYLPQEDEGSHKRIWHEFLIGIEQETTRRGGGQPEQKLASVLNKNWSRNHHKRRKAARSHLASVLNKNWLRNHHKRRRTARRHLHQFLHTSWFWIDVWIAKTKNIYIYI